MNKNQIIIKSTLNNANYYGKKFEEKQIMDILKIILLKKSK